MIIQVIKYGLNNRNLNKNEFNDTLKKYFKYFNLKYITTTHIQFHFKFKNIEYFQNKDYILLKFKGLYDISSESYKITSNTSFDLENEIVSSKRIKIQRELEKYLNDIIYKTDPQLYEYLKLI